MELNREELAWAAGLFDGEGNLRFNPAKSSVGGPSWGNVVVSVCQVDRFVLDRFRKAVLNVGKVYGPYGPYSTTKQAYFMYDAGSFENTQSVIGLLWNWLSPVKRNQAIKALNAYKMRGM